MDDLHHFTKVEFKRFKAFKNFHFEIKHFNILVGPNNAGKSTILAAFRILAAAMRRASARKAILIRGPTGKVHGHEIDLSNISVAEENIFYNYNDDEPASVIFTLSTGNILTLYFPEPGICYLIPDAHGKQCVSPSTFNRYFNCPIGFVPILGPVEHHENLYEKEAARLALFSYRAARNFRNIWHHYPEKFDEFRSALQQTWPGLDILRPEIDRSHEKPRLHMYCPENRIPRELFWAGFGFQVWCQMLTHVIQSRGVSLFLIDEPDIYLHSELQRQLLLILRDLGPDILLATHSTEMITEAETNDIVLVNKAKPHARRIKDPYQLMHVFNVIGSSLNPVLTQLAKTKRVVFVEGKDFQVLAKFARKLGSTGVGNRRDFAVVLVEGFNPERIKNLKAGMEATLGGKINAAAILDRDYRSTVECKLISKSCTEFCDLVVIHGRKEIENFLLVPSAIARAALTRCRDHAARTGKECPEGIDVSSMLLGYCESKKSYITAQSLDALKRFEKAHPTGRHDATITEEMLDQFEQRWEDEATRLQLVGGKEALSAVNKFLQDSYGISVNPFAIIDSMRREEVPQEIVELVGKLEVFAVSPVGE